MTARCADEVLRVEHVTKRFGPVVALRDINLHLRKGEVLGLLGDNGAGKSTLMKIICGFEKPDEGQMFLRGEPYEPKSVDHARSLGIDTVYQDLALIDELSVFQNMFLRREQVHRPLPLLANRAMRSETRAALDEIGINIPQPERARRAPVRRPAAGDRRRADSPLGGRHPAARRAAGGDGRQGGRADPRPDPAAEGGAAGLDHHGPAQLRPRAGELRPGQPDPGRRRSRSTSRPPRPRSRSSPRSSSTSTGARAQAAHGAGAGGMTYVVGIDFGTLSGRAVVVRARDGAELGSAVHEYPHGGHRARAARLRRPRCRRSGRCRIPSDWLECCAPPCPAAVAAAGVAPERGRRASPPTSPPRRRCRCWRDGTPLCRVPGFERRPHAYPKLWKHHAAQRQADRINALAEERGEPWLARYGGRISSEWEFAKALQVLEEDPEVYARMDRWVEARRLDRLAAVRGRDAQRLHGRLQGHPPGRPLPVGRLPARARRALRATSWRRKLDAPLLGRSARAPAA